MATARPCLAQLSRPCLLSTRTPVTFASARSLSTSTPLQKKGEKIQSKKPLKLVKMVDRQKNKKLEQAAAKAGKKKPKNTYGDEVNIGQLDRFALVDAVRYLRAFEAGYEPTSPKYEIHVKLKGPKNGPVVRNRLRLPHPVKTDVRVCVIAEPGSKYALEAKAAGASLVGEEEIFDAIKDGKIEFDRCICQTDSLVKMNKAALGRILGPRGLMPSAKTGTVVKDPAKALQEMIGAAEYRERFGVVRMGIGQLGFSPEELAKNLKAFMEAVKRDTNLISEKIHKEISQVVLSSTHGPGFPLDGRFTSDESVDPKLLSGPN